MRLIKTTVLSIACIACLAGAASAETNWVGIHAGASIPMGDFGDLAGAGFHGGASGTWMFSPALGVGVDVVYHMWSGKDDVTPPGADLTFNALQATGHVMYIFHSPESNFHPWLKGGAGIYNFSGKLEGAGAFDFDESESEMGFNVGGGINLTANPTMSYGLGAAYHSIMTEDETADFFTIGLNLTFGLGAPQ